MSIENVGGSAFKPWFVREYIASSRFAESRSLARKNGLPAKSEQIKAHRNKGAKASFPFVEVTCEEQHRYATLFAGKKRK